MTFIRSFVAINLRYDRIKWRELFNNNMSKNQTCTARLVDHRETYYYKK